MGSSEEKGPQRIVIRNFHLTSSCGHNTYGETKQTLEGYANADGSMAEDRHAITGYAFLINGGALSWSFKCQEIVLLSTTKSEYVTVTHSMKEALWL